MFFIFSEKKTFPIFRNLIIRNLLIFWQRYIQNLGIFRKLSNIYDGTFCKYNSKNEKSFYIFLYFEE